MLPIVTSPYHHNDAEASRSKVTGPRIYYLTALAKYLFYGFAGDRSHPASLIVGDPTVYEKYWKQVCELNISIPCNQLLSYFANTKHMCWYMVEHRRIHVVGTRSRQLIQAALSDDLNRICMHLRHTTLFPLHIVVGTGSSQLIQAALYAHSLTLNLPNPLHVVAAAPHYSTYKEQIDLLQSRLFKWSGDAHAFEKEELVTSPNNPDGLLRQPVLNKPNGTVMYDVAYYWPQCTAITSCLDHDHDIMPFTLSKCTGHAGSRIGLGWAIVKDEEVAKKMVKFMMVSTIVQR